jgi:hypothetical protein
VREVEEDTMVEVVLRGLLLLRYQERLHLQVQQRRRGEDHRL